MDAFAADLTAVWLEQGLELKPRGACAEVCQFCAEPGLFRQMEARVKCGKANCPRASEEAVAMGA